MAKQVLDLGVGDVFGKISAVFVVWTDERESEFHVKTWAEECADAIYRRTGFVNSIPVWFHRVEIAEICRNNRSTNLRFDEAKSRYSKLTPAQREGLRSIWENGGCGSASCLGFLLSKVHSLGMTEKLNRLANRTRELLKELPEPPVDIGPFKAAGIQTQGTPFGEVRVHLRADQLVFESFAGGEALKRVIELAEWHDYHPDW